jgi:hypothetical protein
LGRRIHFRFGSDFDSNIELFEIANLQLLKSRALNNELDKRLEKALQLLKTPQREGDSPVQGSRGAPGDHRDVTSRSSSPEADHNIKLIGDWYSARSTPWSHGSFI